jgi:hypothetical protein
LFVGHQFSEVIVEQLMSKFHSDVSGSEGNNFTKKLFNILEIETIKKTSLFVSYAIL